MCRGKLTVAALTGVQMVTEGFVDFRVHGGAIVVGITAEVAAIQIESTNTAS
jgi:hypothetical protein